jgi:hypothetical protein
MLNRERQKTLLTSSSKETAAAHKREGALHTRENFRCLGTRSFCFFSQEFFERKIK